MGIEKRRHIRIDSKNLSHFLVEEDDRPVAEGMGRTLNISESGVLLETHAPMVIGQSVSVTLALEETLVEIPGQVVHVRPGAPADDGAPNPYEDGIQFNQMDQEAKKILKHFIVLFKRLQGRI